MLPISNAHPAANSTKAAVTTKEPTTESDVPVQPLEPPPTPTPQNTSIQKGKEGGDFHLERKEFDLAIDAYTQALVQAEKQFDTSKIADALKDLGRAFLRKGQWSDAAKVFNGALAVYNKQHPVNGKAAQVVLRYMLEVERNFLERECSLKRETLLCLDAKTYLKNREKLISLRQTLRLKMEQKQSTPQMLAEFTQDIATLLNDIIKQVYPHIGNPPCKFTVLGLGSLGRKEMRPYSQFEFAILIEEVTDANLSYFRKMVRWLEIQIIHLGETSIKILDRGRESPIVKGFSFNEGGNTPLRAEKLIQTPKILAQCQSEQCYEEDVILANVLYDGSPLFGDDSLYKAYVQQIQAHIDAKSKAEKLTFGKLRALNMIEGHLAEFETHFDKQKEPALFFHIQAELYRLPHFLITGLANYYGILETSIWDKLDALANLKVLNKKAANKLKETLSVTMQLLLRCHQHYGKECDEAYHSAMQQREWPKNRLQQAFVLSPADSETVIDIFRVIIPLHRAFKTACQKRDFSGLAKETFYDDSLVIQGEAHQKLLNYNEAKRCFQQALAKHPEDQYAQLCLLKVLFILGDYSECLNDLQKVLPVAQAKKKGAQLLPDFLILQATVLHSQEQPKASIDFFEQAVEAAKKAYGPEHPNVSEYLRLLADKWMYLENPQKAKGYYEQALDNCLKAFGAQHPLVAEFLHYVGAAWIALGDFQKAIDHHDRALRIVTKVYGKNHPKQAFSFKCLGDAWISEDGKKALEYYERALKIFKDRFNDSEDVATALSSLGTAWSELGDAAKAVPFLEEALVSMKSHFGPSHPQVATLLYHQGRTWRIYGKTKEAVECFEEALTLYRKASGNNRLSVANTLTNLGLAWDDMGESNKAIQCQEEALTIKKKIFGDDHASLAPIFHCLGWAWHALGNEEKTIESHTEAFIINKRCFGTDHPSYATSIQILGEAFCDFENYNKGVLWLEQALSLRIKIKGSEHIDVAETLTILGVANRDWGDPHKSLECLQKSLEILEKIHGNEHVYSAFSIYDLSSAYLPYAEKGKIQKCNQKKISLIQTLYHIEQQDTSYPHTVLGEFMRRMGKYKKFKEYLDVPLRVCGLRQRTSPFSNQSK